VAGFVYIQRHWSRECDVMKGEELANWHPLVVIINWKAVKGSVIINFGHCHGLQSLRRVMKISFTICGSLRICLNTDTRKNQQEWNATFLTWPHYWYINCTLTYENAPCTP